MLVISSTDHMGLSAGADVREELDDEGRVHRMELFARSTTSSPPSRSRRSPPATAPCVGGGAEIAVACDLRVGGSTCACASRAPRSASRSGPRAWSPSAASRSPSTCCSPRKEVGADEALRWGLVHRVAPAAATEEAALELAAEVAAHPPEAVARLKRMLHEWDGVVERSRDEGEGQVEWQRSGPGLPYER